MSEQTISNLLKQLRKTSGLAANEVAEKLKKFSGTTTARSCVIRFRQSALSGSPSCLETVSGWYWMYTITSSWSVRTPPELWRRPWVSNKYLTSSPQSNINLTCTCSYNRLHCCAGAKQKEPETRINTEFPAHIVREASGIRTPDNLIKSQIIKPSADRINTGFYGLRLTLYLTL